MIDKIYKDKEQEPLEEIAGRLLSAHGLTVTTAESCTGGLLAGRLVNVPGISANFKEGYITYANEAKEKLLGVAHKTLTEHGAVSEETAHEMAEGVRRAAGADIGVGITGIAGPDGGTKEKPVGLVYIGCCFRGKTCVRRFVFDGNRSEVRESAVSAALTLLCEVIREGVAE